MIAAQLLPAAARRPRSRFSQAPVTALATVVAFLACALVWAAPGASAEPPSNLQQQLTDSAGVLGGDTSEVESRLAELRLEGECHDGAFEDGVVDGRGSEYECGQNGATAT